MGYTVYYEGRSKSPLTQADQALITRNTEQFAANMSDESEGYGWDIGKDGLSMSGATKPALDDPEMETDIQVLVDAVTALSRALPHVTFRVTDDFESVLFSSTDPEQHH
ncbi:MAG: hypothetical protein U0271_08480 [Polyangiaceae bacterium]